MTTTPSRSSRIRWARSRRWRLSARNPSSAGIHLICETSWMSMFRGSQQPMCIERSLQNSTILTQLSSVILANSLCKKSTKVTKKMKVNNTLVLWTKLLWNAIQCHRLSSGLTVPSTRLNSSISCYLRTLAQTLIQIAWRRHSRRLWTRAVTNLTKSMLKASCVNRPVCTRT